MHRSATYIHWFAYAGCVVMCLTACAITPHGQDLSQPPPATSQSRAPALPPGKSALAIFPWAIFEGHETGIAQPEAQRALETSLSNTVLVPTHSYYALNQYPARRISRKDFPDLRLRRLWQGREPNVETIVRLGTALGVKAVFFYDIQVLNGTDFLKAYLVDIASQKVHKVEDTTFDFEENAYATFTRMTQHLFAEYGK